MAFPGDCSVSREGAGTSREQPNWHNVVSIVKTALNNNLITAFSLYTCFGSYPEFYNERVLTGIVSGGYFQLPVQE